MSVRGCFQPPAKHPRRSVSASQISQDGQVEDTGRTTSTASFVGSQNAQSSETNFKVFCTRECVPQNKGETLKDRLSGCKLNIPPTKSFKISVRDSTINVEDLHPFWNEFSKEISGTWWLPTETDSLDLDLNSLKECSNGRDVFLKSLKIRAARTGQTNQSLQKTSFQSLHFSPQGIMAEEVTPKVKQVLAKKIRIYPNEAQTRLFNRCIGCSRHLYNKANSVIRDMNLNVGNYKKVLRLAVIRPKVMVSDKDLPEDMLWQKETPFDTRQMAIKQCINAYVTNFSKQARLPPEKRKQFRVKFMSRKDEEAMVRINPKAFGEHFQNVFSKSISVCNKAIRSTKSC